MKAKRKGEQLRVDLTATEAVLLGLLLDDLDGLLVEPDSTDPVLQRLFPDGYRDDEQAAAEYRELVGADLASQRASRLGLCRAELPAGGGRMLLDPEAAQRWLQVINDLRLALGTRLGVTEDATLDGSDQSVNVYHWLSAVQESMVVHLMD